MSEAAKMRLSISKCILWERDREQVHPDNVVGGCYIVYMPKPPDRPQVYIQRRTEWSAFDDLIIATLWRVKYTSRR